MTRIRIRPLWGLHTCDPFGIVVGPNSADNIMEETKHDNVHIMEHKLSSQVPTCITPHHKQLHASEIQMRERPPAPNIVTFSVGSAGYRTVTRILQRCALVAE